MLEIGLWGCGEMGRSLGQALVATGEAQLTAAFDVRPDAGAQLAAQHGTQLVSAVDNLLGYPGLDGVIIALPPDLHESAVIQAAAAGLHIFVEKPMSLSVSSCQAMLEATRHADVRLMVGQVLRYYEPYRTLLRWNSERRFGDLNAVSIWRVMDGNKETKPWRATMGRSGGPLLEVGAHELDMMRCLLGEPESVHCVAMQGSTAVVEWPDFLSLQIRFRHDRVGVYESGAGSHVGRYGFRLFFSDATVTSDAAFDPKALHVYGPGGRVIDIREDEFSTVNPIEAELRGWLAAVRGETAVPVTGEEGLATVALAVAGYESAATGRVINI